MLRWAQRACDFDDLYIDPVDGGSGAVQLCLVGLGVLTATAACGGDLTGSGPSDRTALSV